MNRDTIKTIAWTVCVCYMIVLPLSIILYYDGLGAFPPQSKAKEDNIISGVNLITEGVFTWLIITGLFGGLVYSLIEARDRIRRKSLARANRKT